MQIFWGHSFCLLSSRLAQHYRKQEGEKFHCVCVIERGEKEREIEQKIAWRPLFCFESFFLMCCPLKKLALLQDSFFLLRRIYWRSLRFHFWSMTNSDPSLDWNRSESRDMKCAENRFVKLHQQI